MVLEYNNIILNIKARPSPKNIMVAIPMNMYRVETNQFSHGLNFFQKTVLKFKLRPGIKDEIIAKYVGLDPKLISIVVSELNSKGLINKHGSLSEEGKVKLLEIDGLIVDSAKKRIGYVLQYVNQVKLYQYYINKLMPADVLEISKNKHPKIITGTKGDGADYTEMPFFLDELCKSKSVLPNPDERDILQLIRNSNKKNSLQPETGNDNSGKLAGQLAMRFLNEQPELIWLCTYVYLEERADKTFEPDWRVLDPFGFGDNIALKFYINSPINKSLLDTIENRFADVKTIGGKILSDYQEQLNKNVEDKVLTDFTFGLCHLDFNLQQYVQAIVKNYILQQTQNYSDLDASVVFSLNIQNALENLLKLDKDKRYSVYERMYRHFETDYKKADTKYDSLISIYRQRLFSQSTLVPKRLLNVSGSVLSKGNSLLSYLVSFILTYNFDYNSPLFKVFRERIDLIIDVAQLRNEKGHGQTSKEKSLNPLKKDDVEKYYTFIKSLINDYIQNQ